MLNPPIPDRAQLIAPIRHRWHEYLMEAWGIAMLLVSAGIGASLLEHPGSPLSGLVSNPVPRNAVLGLWIGLTIIALVYSPWGRQSGAHFNPAFTVSFLRLGKIARADAAWYVLAQFAGGTFGVVLVAAVLGQAFTAPPVRYIVTIPGRAGSIGAFVAEFVIALVVMFSALRLMNSASWRRFTGLAIGALVALAIPLAAPISGMSINPARSFASALSAGVWSGAWVYFIAPVLGMLSATEVYRRQGRSVEAMCAKLDHSPHVRCIHCGYQPAPSRVATTRGAP